MTFYSTGTVHESDSDIRYRVHIEVLPRVIYTPKKEVLWRDCVYPHHALESVCQAAITHLMTQCSVEVDDANYSQVTAPHRKLHAATTFGMRYTTSIKQSRNIKVQYSGLVLARDKKGKLSVALTDLASMELIAGILSTKPRHASAHHHTK